MADADHVTGLATRAAFESYLVGRLPQPGLAVLLVAVFAGPNAAAQAHDAACGLDGRAGEPTVRSALTVTTAADTRETLINRLYATVRRS